MGPVGLCAECLLKYGLAAADDKIASIAADEPVTDSVRARVEGLVGNLGPYRILQKIGEGGMGEVYEAEQTEPIRRRVAVKVIKVGMDTKQVIARFESERQALALMDHPGIARVFDGGATEQGRPYFVMEYVRGVPISVYCERHRLTTIERLELFVLVCEAVNHAHQKGIIHRDIKPSNVLVTKQDGTPVPKIIDFGVAKATQQRLTERTLFTQLGAMVGTPEYMSPEQVELTGLDVDTRTDVYSLGVLLYELLVGALPFDPRKLRGVAFDEVCRRIREEEPARPSMRLSTLGEAAEEAARQRRTDRRRLRRQLRGELDWITMKALEKERNRRYSSANELAQDVRRHLQRHPVVAGPPGWRYRSVKFVQRHRLGVVAGAIVLAALATGLVGLSYGLVRAKWAEARALQEANTAEQVSEFLVDLFKTSDPSESHGETMTAREVLDRGVDRIGEALEEEPELRARMLGTMGRVYSNLGLLSDATPLLDKAMRIEKTLPGADRARRNTRYELGWNLIQLGRYEEAERVYREDYEDRSRQLGEEHALTARSMARLGNLYRILGQFDKAERLLSRSVEIHTRTSGEDDVETSRDKANLAVVYREQGRHADARQLLSEALTGFRRILGDDDVATLTTLRLVGDNLGDLGEYDEAERALRECLKTARRVLGLDHPRVQETVNSLAELLTKAGRYAESREFYRESLRIARETRGEEHPNVLVCLNGLGDTYRREGRFEEAETTLTESLAFGRRVLGEHSLVGAAERYLGLVYLAQNRLEEADALLVEAAETLRNTLGEKHDLALRTLAEAAMVKARRGERERAVEMLGRAVELGLSTDGLADDRELSDLWEDPELRVTFAAILTNESRRDPPDGGPTHPRP